MRHSRTEITLAPWEYPILSGAGPNNVSLPSPGSSPTVSSTVPSPDPAALPLPSRLLPRRLENHRVHRYRGEGFEWDGRELGEEGRAVLLELYRGLEETYRIWRERRGDPDWTTLEARLLRITDRAFVARVEALATRLPSAGDGASLDDVRLLEAGKALHDVRGGAFTSLVVYARSLSGDPFPGLSREDLRMAAVLLARDHAKMMRNALPWIDPAERLRDLEERPHTLDSILGKWISTERVPVEAGGMVSVEVVSSYEGRLASCCLEVSALERVVSNLLANAVRFAAASPVRVEVDPVAPDAVRWLVANRASLEDLAWLHSRCGGEPGRLFRSRVSGGRAGGQGLGLATCADFVCAAFGLAGVDQAVRDGYLGAWWGGGWFAAWIHWPAFSPPPPALPPSP